MERPRVVMSVGASADGKVTLTRQQILMDQPSGKLWASLSPPPTDPVQEDFLETARRHYGCNAVLEGSGSLVNEGAEPPPLPVFTGDPSEMYTHHLPPDITGQPSPPHMWFITVDGRGRVRWTEDHQDWDVLVLVCRTTPADYLAYLRRDRICYLVAGDDRVVLVEAVGLLGTLLGITCVLSTAGGGLIGALVRADLIDELSLTIAPALVGGFDTPSVLDGPSLAVGQEATPLRLLAVHADLGGSVRLHYQVIRPDQP